MDNLRSHKCSNVLKNYDNDNIEVLFLPPYTPEYSAIESLFHFIKFRLKDFKFSSKIVLANKILNIAFQASCENISGFFE